MNRLSALLVPLVVVAIAATDSATWSSTVADPAEACFEAWGVGTSVEVTFLGENGAVIGTTTTISAYPNGARNTICLKIPNEAMNIRWRALGSAGEAGSGEWTPSEKFQVTWNSAHSGVIGRPKGRRPS